MQPSVQLASPTDLPSWREHYLREMNSQVVHDSLHARNGWTESFVLELDGQPSGYAALAVGGPWHGTRTLFEFFVAPARRALLFHAFDATLATTGATALLWQTNDPLLNPLALGRTRVARIGKLVFEDRFATTHALAGAVFRRTTPADLPRLFPHADEPVGDWAIELDGAIAATGGFLTHYNPPFADLYLEVAPAFRRRGIGTFLLQELKRACRAAGRVPCARCSPDNVASHHTCQSAGLVPIAAILEADIPDKP